MTAQRSAKKGEHYTPSAIVEAGREAMGGIDLDPATSPAANTIIQATHILTKNEDGLRYRWFGRLFINSPGSCPKDGEVFTLCGREDRCYCGLVPRFWDHLIGELDAGRTTDAIWIGFNTNQLQPLQKRKHRMSPLHFATCFPKKRIKFLDEDLNEQKQPPHGNYISMVTLNPITVENFTRVFSSFGVVTMPRFSNV